MLRSVDMKNESPSAAEIIDGIVKALTGDQDIDDKVIYLTPSGVKRRQVDAKRRRVIKKKPS